MLLKLKMKKSRKPKGNRLLISVTVLGSAGPIRFVANEEDRVAAVIDLVLKSYAREGRVPALRPDRDSFVLYSPFAAGTPALDPSDAIGSFGGRNFILYSRPPEKGIDEEKKTAVPQKSWKTWFQKSRSSKISPHD